MPSGKLLMEHTLPLNDHSSIPRIGLGTHKLDPSTVEVILPEAIKAGYRHLDCAMVYKNEAAVGSALKRCFSEGICQRTDLFITSKLWNTYHRPELVSDACRKSIKDLKVDYLDLYLMHWPASYEPGDSLFPTDANGKVLFDNVDPEVTWKAMEDLVTSGLVKAIGLSNFNKDQIARIIKCARIKPVALQVEIHVGFLNQDLINFAQSQDLVVTAYSPLGSPGGRIGLLDLFQLPVVQQLSRKYGKTAAQILLRHAIQRGLCVIPKSSNLDRIRDNLNLFDFDLSAEECKLLESAGDNVRRIVPVL